MYLHFRDNLQKCTECHKLINKDSITRHLRQVHNIRKRECAEAVQDEHDNAVKKVSLFMLCFEIYGIYDTLGIFD